MKATAINGDEWTGEKDGDWWMYRDKAGNLYESREVPAYRVDLRNLCAAFETDQARYLIATPLERTSN